MNKIFGFAIAKKTGVYHLRIRPCFYKRHTSCLLNFIISECIEQEVHVKFCLNLKFRIVQAIQLILIILPLKVLDCTEYARKYVNYS